MASIRAEQSFVAVLIAGTTLGGGMAFGQATQIPSTLVTPDKVDSSIGTLDFKDDAPSPETIKKVYDILAFTRGLDAFLNSYGGASSYAIPIRAFLASVLRTTPSPSSRADGF